MSSKSKKTVNRTIASKAARKTKEIDPRLERVFAVIDAAWADDSTNTDSLFALLLTTALVESMNPNNTKAAIACLLKGESDANFEAAITKLVEVADAEHRMHCQCCAARHAAGYATEVAS